MGVKISKLQFVNKLIEIIESGKFVKFNAEGFKFFVYLLYMKYKFGTLEKGIPNEEKFKDFD